MSEKIEGEAELKPGEPHPSAHTAFVWWHQTTVEDPIMMAMIKESIASTALSGNRLAELCMSTINRLDAGKPISDRYLLGLCWFVRDMIEHIRAGKEEEAIVDTKKDAVKPKSTKKPQKKASKGKKK